MIKNILRYQSYLLIILIITFFHLNLFLLYSQVNNKVSKYIDISEEIRNLGLNEEGAYDILEKILSAGPRFAGSPGYAASTEITYQMMQDYGFDNVWLEPVTVPRWVRGEPEIAKIINSRTMGDVDLSIAALGGSIATPEIGITAPVIEVKSFEELEERKNEVNGKIVFFNRQMDRTFINTFEAYVGAVSQRTRGAVEAAKHGAAAVLVRSLTHRIDDYPHTGGMWYQPDVKKIPAASISTKGAKLLSELLQNEPDVQVYMKLNSKTLPPVINHNVIGEIRGSEIPEEIVLIGAHLDSWDITPGAHDDGAGCAQVIEALRLIRELGLQPKRTIRGVLFANEEFGVSGGRGYAASENRDGERHIAAMESDRGGFLPLGFTIDDEEEIVEHFKQYHYLFEPMNMFRIEKGYSGVDIAPLKEHGTIVMGLLVDSQRYFDLHHSAKDTIDEVNPRELELGAIAMAILAYVISEDGVPDLKEEEYLSN